FDEQGLGYGEEGAKGVQAAWQGRDGTSACLHGGTRVPATDAHQALWTHAHQQGHGQKEGGGVCDLGNESSQEILEDWDWAKPLAEAAAGSTAGLLESNPDSEGSSLGPMSDGDRSDFSPEDLLAISPEVFSGSEDSLTLPTPRAEFVDLVPLAQPFPSAPTAYGVDAAASGSDDLLLRETESIAARACRDRTAGMSGDRAAAMRLEQIERGMVSLSVIDDMLAATAE
ncbi:unnamed protein product, partial [Laminaria digitata]